MNIIKNKDLDKVKKRKEGKIEPLKSKDKELFSKIRNAIKKKTRMFMKKLSNALPFILLVSLVGLSFVKPDISVSISIIGLAALTGYKLYLDSVKKPNYEKIFAERLEEINKVNKDRMDNLDKELGKVKFRGLDKTVASKQQQTPAGW